MKTKYVPVYDGKLPADPDVVPVLLPTDANIHAMRRSGNYQFAFELMCSRLVGNALRALYAEGIEIPLPPELLEDSAYFQYAATQVDDILARTPNPSQSLLSAKTVLDYFLEVTRIVGRASNARTAASMAELALISAGLGKASAEFPDVISPAIPTLATMQLARKAIGAAGGMKSGKVRGWWHALGLPRAVERRKINPAETTAHLARRLRKELEAHFPEGKNPNGKGRLPKTDGGYEEAIGTWQTDDLLPRATLRTPSQVD